jgi:hypothetical protein
MNQRHHPSGTHGRAVSRSAARAAIIIALAVSFALSCSDASSDRQDERKGGEKKIGGCLIDTIAIGTGFVRHEAPRGTAAWIEVLSLKELGAELFRQTAEELTTLLDTLGIPVYTRSELLHVKRGPCWPAYRVGLRINVESKKLSEPIREALLGMQIAGATSAAERPKGYGLFFISCGAADRDWWTVWYEVPAEDE